ncbi:glycosyltransferase family 87 protein [uncultured Mucilaginibacter sp.]|uniref:glycosyltransferase family 87 protein n=1 Tax=uncultured Mucilaginibacter sp. TaxID=797541 RepID=UPI0025FE5EBA|nr:glycosyltransferase family 87 protein [uncultured Mucilaginibacter sp.]
MKRRLNQLSAYTLVSGLYFLVSFFSWLFKYFNNRYNNYSIFKYVYYHTVQQKNLYNYYPAEYGDSNHYGVVFSLIIAPFALLPDGAGFLLFCVLNAALIVLAIRMLPLPSKHKMFIMLFSVMEFANASHYIQFNAVITAIIIFSFLLVEDEKDEWATLFIVLGTLIKLYPIVGITFFLFSKHKVKFVIWGFIWTGVFLALPMLISSRQFVLQCYIDWYESLHAKNIENLGLNSSQDISVMGTARHLTRNINIPNWPFLLLGVMGFGLPLLRLKQYAFQRFRYQVLASALMLIVLFSTGSEHPTYIIAVVGATLWIFMKEKPFTRTNIVLLVLLVLITGLGPTDAFPKYIRHEFINKYVMKAWPCIAVWCIITYELMFKNFANAGALTQKKQQINTEPELVLV